MRNDGERLQYERQRRTQHDRYRPTRVWGLHSLPEHWREKPLKRLVTINPDKLSDSTDPDWEMEYVDIGNVTLVDGIGSTEKLRFETAPSRARRLVRDGDTIASTVRTYLKAVAQIKNPPDNLVVSTGFAVLRARAGLASAYLYRLCQCDAFVERVVAHSTGVSYPAINASDIGNFEVPLPPLDEQRAIAAFLDRETARIDELIVKKERIVTCLAEKKSIVSGRAVTLGLDQSVALQPTSIPWLPQVPATWSLSPLKHVAEIHTGLTLGKKYGENVDLVRRPYLRVANVQDGYLDLAEITTVEIPPQDAPRYELRTGDVLLTEGGDFDKLGRGYVWEGQINQCLHQNHIFAVRPDVTILDPQFLAAQLSSTHGKHYFTSTSNQTTNLASTNSTKLGGFPVVLPQLDEQRRILDFVRAESVKLDTAVATIGEAITRLREYRSTLVSAAVTGKIDVRQETR